LNDKLKTADLITDSLIDSFPVIIARGKTAGRSKIVAEIANLRYCASKQIYCHGVKLHTLARPRLKKLPVPRLFFHLARLQRTI
jgi:hypothetical protein